MTSSIVSGDSSVHGPRLKDMQDSPVTSLHLMPLGPRRQNSYFTSADSGSLAGSSKPLGPSTPMLNTQSLLTTQSLGPSTPIMATQSLLTTQSVQSIGPSTPPAPSTPPQETPPPRSDIMASASARVRSLEDLRKSVFGSHEIIPTPFGPRTLVYMDWAASGRLLKPLEDFMTKEVYPHYANVHSEVGHCAGVTGGLVVNARDTVLEFCGANTGYSVIFGGSGMTGAVAKLAHLLGIQRCPRGFKEKKRQPASNRVCLPDGKMPVVFFSNIEHHSNCVFWREMDCVSVCIHEDASGLPDQGELERQLQKHLGAPLLLGTFTAGSNVTGVMPDVHALATLMHKYGGYAVFDYASAASSSTINCSDGLAPESRLDAVMLSPHKFPGGPGTTGALVIRDEIIREFRPQVAGGGCVLYVTPKTHEYLSDVEFRETAGTPNVLGIIRTGLCLQLQMSLGIDRMHAISHAYTMRAINVWRLCPGLRLVGADRPAYHSHQRMPIVSFNVFVRRFDVKPGDRIGRRGVLQPPSSTSSNPYGSLDEDEGLSDTMWLHPLFITQLLNDVYGIQSRGGCACAGPYGAALLEDWIRETCGLDIDALMRYLEPGKTEGIRPGWCRVYFSHLMTPQEVDYVIRAVLEVATLGWKLLPLYDVDCSSGTFTHVSAKPQPTTNRLAVAVQHMLGRTSAGTASQPADSPRDRYNPLTPRSQPTGSRRRYMPCMAPSSLQTLSDRIRRVPRPLPPLGPIAKAPPSSEPSPFTRRLDEEVKLRLDEQMAEAEAIYKNAGDSVTSCRPLNAQWEQDVHACESRYFDFMHSRARWFMLPHEAAAALRAGADLSWMSYYQPRGSRHGKYTI